MSTVDSDPTNMSTVDSDPTQTPSGPDRGAAHLGAITTLITTLEILNINMQRIYIAGDIQFDMPTRRYARSQILSSARSLAQIVMMRKANALLEHTMSELDKATIKRKMRVVKQLEDELMELVIVLERSLETRVGEL